MRKLKDYIVEIADENDGFIIVEAMNEESACRKAERLGYEVFYAHELYATKKELYDSCMKSEAGIKIIAMAVFNEEGELLGYKKYWVD